MRVGSLFSGIGGFDLGLERAGHEVVWQVEKDAKARSVLRRHWPDVDLHEDVRDVGTDELARVDLICGGFPCQDLSVAGKRAGLDGARSGLWFEFHRIVSELVPTWVLIENVPGLLSSNGGADFAVVLSGLAELGYRWSYRVLDSRYFGVAQRRRRVFVLACRDPRAGCPAEVLALAEGLSGHPAPSRAAGPEVAPSPSARASYDCGDGSEPIVAHILRAEGHDASEDGTGRGTPIVLSSGQANAEITEDCAPTPNLNRDGAPISFNWQSGGDVRHDVRHDETGALHVGQVPAIFTTGHQGDRVVTEDGIACALPASGANNGGGGGGQILGQSVLRRLTPTECERLQGFPDDWTRWDSGGDELADSPRYKMMGNAVSVPVAEWIGRRLSALTRPQRL